jgi:hypothetical protein
MQLEQRELEELAAFFAKRFGDLAAREELAARAAVEVDAGQGWSAILSAASEQGKMGALAAAAVDRRPDDDNLRELAGTLKDEGVSTRVMAVAAAVLLLLGLGGAAWYGSADNHLEKLHPGDEGLAQQIPPVPAIVEPVEPVIEDLALPVEAAEAVESTALVEPTVVDDAEVLAVPVDEVPAPAPPATGGRCAAAEGELVGFWYAGHPFEVGQGEVYTLKHGKYVRAGYPARDNDWDHQQAVRCALQAGDRVRLSHAPVLVDGGKYWVPLHGGDLLGPAR